MSKIEQIDEVGTPTDSTRNQRIKESLKQRGISQQVLADKLGITSAAVNERLNKPSEIDSIEFVQAVAILTGLPFEYIMTGKSPVSFVPFVPPGGKVYHIRDFDPSDKSPVVQDSANTSYLVGKDIRPVVVTVTPAGQELVTFVPVKAQAGYMKGYGDPHFIERLPAFTLPGVVKDATYRMFEVDGDSMLQLGNKGLRSGEIVIARYVEDIFDMKDNRVYVVISTEGTAIKRCLNRLKDKENPCLIMTSDNKNGQHPNYILKPKQIKEVWEAKRFISADFSFDTNLYEILGDLQAEQAILKEEVKKLKGK